MTPPPIRAVEALCSIINTGDLAHAWAWAIEHADALFELRRPASGALAMVAHACWRWRAPIVWPWGDRPTPTPAQARVLRAMRAGKSWRASEDTVVVILACGWAVPRPEGGYEVLV